MGIWIQRGVVMHEVDASGQVSRWAVGPAPNCYGLDDCSGRGEQKDWPVSQCLLDCRCHVLIVCPAVNLFHKAILDGRTVRE